MTLRQPIQTSLGNFTYYIEDLDMIDTNSGKIPTITLTEKVIGGIISVIP